MRKYYYSVVIGVNKNYETYRKLVASYKNKDGEYVNQTVSYDDKLINCVLANMPNVKVFDYTKKEVK